MQIYAESMRCSECGCGMTANITEASQPHYFYRHFRNGCPNSGKDFRVPLITVLPFPMDSAYEALDSRILEEARTKRF